MFAMQAFSVQQRCCLVVMHDRKSGVSDILLNITQYLRENGLGVVCIHLDDLLSYRCQNNCEFALTCGGDGLAIFVGRVLALYDIPVFVMNLGVVGFVTEFSAISWKAGIKALLEGHLNIQEHSLLHFALRGNCADQENISNFALNEVLLKGNQNSGICEFEIAIGSDKSLGIIRSDGLMIVTPTGSTAYALSCGGPLIAGEVFAFLVMAVNPHALSYRHLVISGDREITLKLSKSNRYEISCLRDGQFFREFTKDDTLKVEFSKKKARFIVDSDYSFFAALRSKLGWGAEVSSKNRGM